MTTDEHMDRFAAVLPDGTYLTIGAHGFEPWTADRLEEAGEQKRWVRKLPEHPDYIAVQSPLLCSRRSEDRGKSWQIREWEVPGVKGL